jgi:hypothetical protein
MPAIAEDFAVAHPLLDDSFDLDAMDMDEMRQALQTLARERDVRSWTLFVCVWSLWWCWPPAQVLKATLAKVGKFVGASKRLKKQSPQLQPRGSPTVPQLQLASPVSAVVAVDGSPLARAVAELSLKIEQLVELKSQLEMDVLSLIEACGRPVGASPPDV